MSLFRWITFVGPGLLTVHMPDDFELHARPAVLIAQVVQHHRAPVALEIDGQSCSPHSILELLIRFHAVGRAREFVFRGPENALRDLRRLFEHDLGESGLASLPPELDFLRRIDTTPEAPR